MLLQVLGRQAQVGLEQIAGDHPGLRGFGGQAGQQRIQFAGGRRPAQQCQLPAFFDQGPGHPPADEPGCSGQEYPGFLFHELLVPPGAASVNTWPSPAAWW